MCNLLGVIIASFCLMCLPAQAQAAKLSKGEKTFRDCAECPEIVVIPAGSFDMGSPDSEGGRNDDEGPVHRVEVAAFGLGKTEITRRQYAAFVNQTRHTDDDKCWTLENSKYEERAERNWRKPGYTQKDNHPATCINWNDAKAYSKWLSRKTGKKYRLPTEAEWEYAARSKTTTARYWGAHQDEACGYANTADMTAQELIPGTALWKVHKCSDKFAYTAPVGNFKSNDFSLQDMLGNVWEWVEDSYLDSYKNSPTEGSAQLGSDGMKRVLRGGSWNNDPDNVRAAVRNRNTPETRFNSFGFRIARTLP